MSYLTGDRKRGFKYQMERKKCLGVLTGEKVNFIISKKESYFIISKNRNVSSYLGHILK